MQIGGLSDSSMIYQQYAEMARQRRLGGAVGMEETDEAQDAPEVNYAAAMQQMEVQQAASSYEIASPMETGDRAAESYADPAEMMRTLAASGRGFYSADSIPEMSSGMSSMSPMSAAAGAGGAIGAADSGASFWNEVLRNFSDTGAYANAMQSRVNSAYGMR